jgi:hypothetical protein
MTSGFATDTTPLTVPWNSSTYSNTNTSFSGCDIKASVTIGNLPPKNIGNITTLSYSIHREKYPVRALGFTGMRGMTRGSRTVAGTIVFAVFDRYALYDIAKTKDPLDKGLGESYTSILGDQMRPFDITCSIMNEQGISSILCLYGVELVDEGQTMSVQDIYTESTHSYIARDIDVLFPTTLGAMTDTRPYLSEGTVNVLNNTTQSTGLSASELLELYIPPGSK